VFLIGVVFNVIHYIKFQLKYLIQIQKLRVMMYVQKILKKELLEKHIYGENITEHGMEI